MYTVFFCTNFWSYNNIVVFCRIIFLDNKIKLLYKKDNVFYTLSFLKKVQLS